MTEYTGNSFENRRTARHAAATRAARLSKGVFQTLPILLVGSMAMSLNLTGPIDSAAAKRADKPKDGTTELRKAVRDAMAAASSTSTASASTATAVAAAAPATYRVVGGDTVSSIAARYGLATASVLALNGLGWKSLIFPGQVLRLTAGAASAPPAAPAPVTPAPSVGSEIARYTIVKGDTISGIAARFGVSTQSILSANGLGWSSIIYPGRSLVIPGGSSSTGSGVVDITPVVSVTPVVTPPAATPPASSTSYVIKAGDTVSSIAARFGVSVQAVLDANGLTRSSIIYSGRTLTIPGASSAPAAVGGYVTPLTAEMEQHARTIIAVGRSLGVSDYGIVIALAAAAQESTLRNLNWGDRDSLGLFQQRPSTGWGTPAQVTDPVHSARLFYGGPQNPNKGKTRGLLDISGWQSMTVTQAAQAVQRSAYPDAYAKWETSARAWLAQLS